jgi:hypothetical protein
VQRVYAVAYWRYSWRFAFPEIMARMEAVGYGGGRLQAPRGVATQPPALTVANSFSTASLARQQTGLFHISPPQSSAY